MAAERVLGGCAAVLGRALQVTHQLRLRLPGVADLPLRLLHMFAVPFHILAELLDLFISAEGLPTVELDEQRIGVAARRLVA